MKRLRDTKVQRGRAPASDVSVARARVELGVARRHLEECRRKFKWEPRLEPGEEYRRRWTPRTTDLLVSALEESPEAVARRLGVNQDSADALAALVHAWNYYVGTVIRAARIGLDNDPDVKPVLDSWQGGLGRRDLLRRVRRGLEVGVRRPMSNDPKSLKDSAPLFSAVAELLLMERGGPESWADIQAALEKAGQIPNMRRGQFNRLMEHLGLKSPKKRGPDRATAYEARAFLGRVVVGRDGASIPAMKRVPVGTLVSITTRRGALVSTGRFDGASIKLDEGLELGEPGHYSIWLRADESLSPAGPDSKQTDPSEARSPVR